MTLSEFESISFGDSVYIKSLDVSGMAFRKQKTTITVAYTDKKGHNYHGDFLYTSLELEPVENIDTDGLHRWLKGVK